MILTCVSCGSHRSVSPARSPGRGRSSLRRDRCGPGSPRRRSLHTGLQCKTRLLVPPGPVMWQEIVELFHILGEIGTIPVICMERAGVSNVCSLTETFKV